MRINRAPTLGKPWHTIWVGRAKSPSALASVSKPVIVSVRLEFLSGADYRDDGESEVAPLFEAIEAVRPLIEKRAITRRFLSGRLRVWNEDHFHWAGTPPYGYRCVGGGPQAGAPGARRVRWPRRSSTQSLVRCWPAPPSGG
jgi:hypothetical protein